MFRSIVPLLIAVLLTGAELIMPAPAHAQSLGDIVRVLDGTRYSGCGYQSGVYKASCEAGRIGQIVDSFADSQRRAKERQGEQVERQAVLMSALKRACDAGDRHSCVRLSRSGASEQTMTVARALMDACRAGDRFSCDRVQAVMNGRDPHVSGR